MPTILIVEDRESLRLMLAGAVEKMGFRVEVAEDGQKAVSAMRLRRYDLVLTDLRLPKGSGIEVLKACKGTDNSAPVIVMTAYGTIEEAVQAMKEGAYDFIQKPIDLDHLRLLLERAIEQERLVRENTLLREVFRHAQSFPEMVGEDESIKGVEREIQKVAPTEATVLIQGESGTGKELVARTIHQLSPRAQRPFVAINCAAIPETLIENELFGHEKGAYTGADVRRLGKFELAHRGTLFLDEIGELPLQIQSKILRALETKTFERIGSVQTQESDVRIIAATNRDLREAVSNKLFREDLYFRLSVVPIAVPPLRDRKGDLRLLADHFLRKFGREFKKERLRLSSDAFRLMQSYDWPGNIRELQNCMERAVIMCEGVEIVPDDLVLVFQRQKLSKDDPAEYFDLSGSLSEVGLRAITTVEKAKILQALRDAKWNKSKAAQMLDVGYKTLLGKIRDYGLVDQ